MLSFTLETAFMLKVFQLLVAGLVLGGSLTIFYQQKDSRWVLSLVAVAFSFYCLLFILQGALSYRSLSLPASTALSWQWELALQLLEKAAVVLLCASFFTGLLRARPGKFWIAVAVLFLLLTATPYLGWGSSSAASAFINGLCLLATGGFNLRSRTRKGLLAAVALFFLAGAQFIQVAEGFADDSNWPWSVGNASLLAGLGLIALVVEGHSNNFPARFFLRLNLIFIGVASMLILSVAEMERHEYLSVAEQNTQELFEYLRGQVIYASYRGLDPREALASPEVVGKITADFARLPDLQRVRVNLQGWTMEMAIDENWLITHQIYRDGRHSSGKRQIEDRGRVATLTPVTIESRGQVLGSIEVDENLRTINSQVARHMRVIYLTFTAAVFVAAGLFGVTVQYAHKTIQRQFQELEKANAQLLHAERLASVGKLAGGVAHEINNPAGIILTTSDYLLRESQKRDLPESFHESLQAIRRQAWRVSEIVNGLLTFSRPMRLHKQPVDVNAVLRQSLGLLAPRYREQHVRVEENLAPNLPQVSGDPSRLEQVFVNLLNNAADAMPGGGAVKIETGACQRGEASYLMVSIADTGTGIAPEHLPNIFDPFFSTKARGKGTGLGLSVSHGIIRDHSGLIEADNCSGQGAVFRVYLPLGGDRLEGISSAGSGR